MFIYYCILYIVFGSFIQCLIDRYPKYLSGAYSHCDHCFKRLYLFDLIPIFSYLSLNGKCRYCKNKISLSKISTEIVFLIVYIILYIFKLKLEIYILFSALYLGSMIDIKHQEIPDLSVFIIFILVIYLGLIPNYKTSLYILVIGIILSYLNLMGFGDIKLLVTLSFFIDYYQFLIGLLLSCTFALIYLLINKQHKKGTIIFFMPFISISYFLIIVLNQIK